MKPLSNLMKNIGKFYGDFKVNLYKNYGENPGKMLVHTGTLGWILSSLAQVTALVFNDKISSEQKSFLIPQEIADAGINILSFYLITNSFKNLASKMVSTGKLTTKSIQSYLQKNGLCSNGRVGKLDFNIEKLDDFKTGIKEKYQPFKESVDVVASTIGSVISCNLVTPVLRNIYASDRQKNAIAKMEIKEKSQIVHPRGITLNEYQKNAAFKLARNSTSLKI